MLEGDTTEGEGWFAVGVLRVNGEDFGFGLVDGEEKQLCGTFEGKDKTFEALSRVTDDGHSSA